MSDPQSRRTFVWRDALVALSLANLLLLRLWSTILDPSAEYRLENPRPWQTYAAALALMILFAAIGSGFAVAVRARERLRAPVELLLGVTVAIAIWMARHQITAARPNTEERIHLAIGAACLSLVALFALPRTRSALRKGTVRLLLVLSPFAAMTTWQSVQRAVSSLEPFPDRTPAARVPATGGTRVIVVVFDELDSFWMYEDRPAVLEMPRFDALAQESFLGRRAHAPANLTELSLPSLLTGKRVVEAPGAGTSDRALVFEDGRRARFSEVETVFTDAQKAGVNAGLSGWYHPYCRVLGDDVASCVDRSYTRDMLGMSVPGAMAHELGLLLDVAPHGRKLIRMVRDEPRRIIRIDRAWHAESQELIHAEALDLVADRGLGLVFLHYPLPHAPGISDLQGRPSATGTKPAFNGNLAHIDVVLGELIDRMKAENLWDRSALIITGDHPKRTNNLDPWPTDRIPEGQARPVPYFVRLPNGGPGITDVTTVFDNLVTRELVDAIRRGDVRDHQSVRAWIRRVDAAPGTAQK